MKNPAAGWGSRRGLSKHYDLGKEPAYRSNDSIGLNSRSAFEHIQHFTFRNESRLL